MAISGPKYLVMESALVGAGRWTTDLAPKPNCYLSAELATERVRELEARALHAGEVRTFRVHLSADDARLSPVVPRGEPVA